MKGVARIAVLIAGISGLAGCDAWYESMQSVPLSATGDANDDVTRARVLAAVRDYAAAESIACQSKPGFLVYCHRQPIYLTVREAGTGVEVCYIAMGAQFEEDKFEARMQRLASRVDAAAGKTAPRQVPKPTDCTLQ